MIALSYWATGPWILQEVWNPHEAFPFFALFLLQCWLLSQGDTARLAGVVFVASFLVQTHIGYAPPVLVIGGWALARVLLSERRAGRAPARWRLWGGPLALAAGLWFIPVVLDTVLHFPGNLVILVKFYLGLDHNRQPLLGLYRGLGYLATEFRWLPPWLGGQDRLDHLTGLARPSSLAWLLVPVVLVGLAWWAARRRGRADLRLMAELLAVGSSRAPSRWPWCGVTHSLTSSTGASSWAQRRSCSG